MMSERLRRAREYEARYGPLVPAGERPLFHVTGAVGWINDPNGFSCYRGEYHLFYQYHPYSTRWGPMHWGHVKTRDFIRWERLPAALAPDQAYDRDGCFSGSAVETPDGRHLLMYTGVHSVPGEDGRREERQCQCVALGDGVDYEKYEGDPVLTGADLPAGGSPRDFRDPKLWREPDGAYRAVVADRAADGSGAVLLYGSGDGLHWRFETVVDACRGEYGQMWECPDFFPLDGKQVLIVSPEQMQAREPEFHGGNGNIALLGAWEDGRFSRERVQLIDHGADFYAAQTLLTYDGRRVMIAWMQNWASVDCRPQEGRIFGEMTLPRELAVRDGRLVQVPVRELENYRRRRVAYRGVPVTDETALAGVSGRVLDMTVTVRPAREGCRAFWLTVAQDESHGTSIRYEPATGLVRVDRSRCGVRCGADQARQFRVRPREGRIRLRLVMDRHSLELFVNDGEQAATFLLYTPASADGILFRAEGGGVLLDVEKYALDLGGEP